MTKKTTKPIEHKQKGGGTLALLEDLGKDAIVRYTDSKGHPAILLMKKTRFEKLVK